MKRLDTGLWRCLEMPTAITNCKKIHSAFLLLANILVLLPTGTKRKFTVKEKCHVQILYRFRPSRFVSETGKVNIQHNFRERDYRYSEWLRGIRPDAVNNKLRIETVQFEVFVRHEDRTQVVESYVYLWHRRYVVIEDIDIILYFLHSFFHSISH